MFADYHVHTDFSDDSHYPLEDVIKDAIAMKMDEICITDHVDYGIKVDWDSGKEIVCRHGDPLANVDYPKYMRAIKDMQSKYGDKITIKTGLEFGIQMHTIDQFEQLFDRYRFDFILLSVHQVEDKEFWTQDFQRGRSQQQYNERYYEEMLNLVENYQNYSVLAHMDLITRYDEAGIYPFEKIKPLIKNILSIVIQNGKGIEFNTSYGRYGLNDTTPSIDILKLYHEMGGKLITIGSDGHKPEHLGVGFDEAKRILKKLGFEAFCTYQNMQPIFHQL